MTSYFLYRRGTAGRWDPGRGTRGKGDQYKSSFIIGIDRDRSSNPDLAIWGVGRDLGRKLEGGAVYCGGGHITGCYPAAIHDVKHLNCQEADQVSGFI